MASGDLLLSIQSNAMHPGKDLTMDLGEVALRFKNLYLGGSIIGNIVMGSASTSTLTCTGRLIVRTLASDPKHVTPANRPTGSVAEIAYYSGKMYFCTSATTPVWELITSA